MGRGNSYHNQPRPAKPETEERNGKTASIQKQVRGGAAAIVDIDEGEAPAAEEPGAAEASLFFSKNSHSS